MGCRCSPPAWVLFPPQLGYYYPLSLDTTTTLPALVPLLPFQLQYHYYPSSFSTTTLPALVLLLFQLQYYYPRQLSEFVVRRRNRSGTSFRAFLLLSQVSPMYYLGSRPDGAVILTRCYPSRFFDFLEELVVGDGIKNTRPAFTCNLQGRSAAHFRKHLFSVLYYCVYRQSHPSKIIYYLCSSKSIAVKAGLLLKYVLIGCTVTESKCSRIT